MAQVSSAKIKCKGINQIAIVVEDLERVAENYWTILGIGPWAIYEWEAPLVYDRKYHGQTAWARERIAWPRSETSNWSWSSPLRDHRSMPTG